MNLHFFCHKAMLFFVVSGFFLAAYPAPRGRVSMEGGTVVTDRGTHLRGLPLWLGPYIDEDSPGTLGFIREPEYRDFFRKISRDYGLNTIRLCYTAYHAFNGERYTKDQIVPQTYEPAIDSFVKWAAEDGIYVIINYHDVGHYDLDHMKQFWEYIAPKYKDETHVLYELMNEPVKWYARNYDDEDIAMVKTLHELVLTAASQTHQILWTFANLGGTGQAVSKVDVEGISYDNASIGFHYGYGGGGEEEIQELKDAGYAAVCTEFKSKDESTKSTDFERLINNVKVFEMAEISWQTWAPTLATPNEKLVISDLFPTKFDSAGICWVPDFGNWPSECTEDTTGQSENKAPNVETISADTVLHSDSLLLEATVTDDGLPENGEMSYEWRKELGPGNVTFTSPNEISTYAQFSAVGEYTVGIQVHDGEKASSEIIAVTVLDDSTPLRGATPPKPGELLQKRATPSYDVRGRKAGTPVVDRPLPERTPAGVIIGENGTEVQLKR